MQMHPTQDAGLALAGAVQQQRGHAALQQCQGAGVVFLPPAVGAAEDDHGGRVLHIGRPHEPTMQHTAAVRHGQLLVGRPGQLPAPTERIRGAPVHGDLLRGVMDDGRLGEAEAGCGVEECAPRRCRAAGRLRS